MYRLFILFLAFMLSTVSFAQADLKVRSMTLTTSHIPAADKRNDYNNKPCALVKIQVVDEVERVEGYTIGKVVKKSGVEHWAYMCHDSKSMKIHFRNHLPVEVKFRDFQIEALEGNRVYELILQDGNGKNIGESTNKLQKLIMDYSPADATVMIDNIQRYGNNGRIEVELSVGEEHSYIITANGYYASQGSVMLSSLSPKILRETLVPTSQSGQQNTTSGNTQYGGAVSQRNVTGGLVETRTGTVNRNYEGEKRTKKENKEKEVKPEKRNKINEDTYLPEARTRYGQGNTVREAPDLSSAIVPPTSLNKSFSFNYDGVDFECKAKKGYVTIVGFATYAESVTIPATVEYKGLIYPVIEVDTYKNGVNYHAKRIVIQKGIKEISHYCFNEFRSLQDVTIPNTVTKVGKNAFRSKNVIIHAPSYMDLGRIQEGKSFEY